MRRRTQSLFAFIVSFLAFNTGYFSGRADQQLSLMHDQSSGNQSSI